VRLPFLQAFRTSHFSKFFLINSISEMIAFETVASAAVIAFAPLIPPSVNLV
jgi:hypothetical protein